MEKPTKPLILAQCMAYHTLEETLKLCEVFIAKQTPAQADIYLSAPHSYIRPLSEKFGPAGIHVGAESMLSADDGSFSKSISGNMLKDIDAKFVLIGTAQERQFIKDKKLSLTNKALSALQAGITPFICVSETEIEYHDGKSKEVIMQQLNETTAGLSHEQQSNLHIFYDAAWMNKSPWSAESNVIQTACNTFYEAVSKAFDPAVLSTLNLIAPVPAFSYDLPKIIADLQTASHPFYGFSLGCVDSSAEFVVSIK